MDTGGIRLQKCSRCLRFYPMTTDFFHVNNHLPTGVGRQCKNCLKAVRDEWKKTDKAKAYLTDARERGKRSPATLARRQRYLPIRREREAKARLSDPTFCLKVRVRCLMYQGLRGIKNSRRWQDLVGYAVEDLRRHIEKQFTGKMSWDAFMAGKIHIDHIIPVSAFNFQKPEDLDFRRCWAMKNLRPMWAKENLSKSARLAKPFQPSLPLEA